MLLDADVNTMEKRKHNFLYAQKMYKDAANANFHQDYYNKRAAVMGQLAQRQDVLSRNGCVCVYYV